MLRRNLIKKIRQAKSLPVNLSKMFIEFSNDTICRVAFGRTYSGENEGINFNEVMKEFNKVLAEFNVGDLIPWLGWIDRINGRDAKIDKIAQVFDEFLERVVREHEDRLVERRKNKDSDSCEQVKDIVDVLLDIQENQTLQFPIDRDCIKALILVSNFFYLEQLFYVQSTLFLCQSCCVQARQQIFLKSSLDRYLNLVLCS